MPSSARHAIEVLRVVRERYTGIDGARLGMETFGASAPLKELQRKFGFEPEKVVAMAMELLGRK